MLEPAGEAANYRAILAYDGTAYAGFQVQRDLPTIQGTLEAVLARLTGEAVRITGAGRTDAGVHASGQVISFHTAWRHGTQELQRAMNALLPNDIALRSLDRAADSFDARFSAVRRTYIYSIYQDATRAPLRERYAWHIAEALDIAAMQSAAGCLLGRGDCSAFGQDPRGGQSTERWIYAARWEAEPPDVRFELTADAFLRGMVRRIVGSLVQVGLGRWSPEEFGAVRWSGQIERSAPAAPARGLCLWHVQYADDENRAQEQPGDTRS